MADLMDIDPPVPPPPPPDDRNGAPSLNIKRTLAQTTTELTQIIADFKPAKHFPRETREGQPTTILSLDFDDPGELLMTSESDETIQIYNVREGRHEKSLLSKKYGAKLARFTHHSSSIIYASTKQNDAIRYLATHDNSFIRYFEGHEASVTALAMHPGQDNFISCGKDNTVQLWNVQSKNRQGMLFINNPALAAWDPAGMVFAIASPAAGSILLYDYKNFTKAPIGVIDVVEQCCTVENEHILSGWTKLEFSNDGKWILLGAKGNGHFLFDAFEYKLKAYLRKPNSGTSRAAVGEAPPTNDAPVTAESSGDCCFTPDGRFIMSGSKQNVYVWDTLSTIGDNKILDPTHILEEKSEAAVLAFNPRFNFFATADKELLLWTPDPHA